MLFRRGCNDFLLVCCVLSYEFASGLVTQMNSELSIFPVEVELLSVWDLGSIGADLGTFSECCLH